MAASSAAAGWPTQPLVIKLNWNAPEPTPRRCLYWQNGATSRWEPTPSSSSPYFLFLVTLFSGLGLSRNLRLNDPRPSGKPLASAAAGVHKLLALAAMIAATVAIRNLHRGIEFRTVELTAVGLAGLLLLLMIITGSLLSLGRPRSTQTLRRSQTALASRRHSHLRRHLPFNPRPVVIDWKSRVHQLGIRRVGLRALPLLSDIRYRISSTPFE